MKAVYFDEHGGPEVLQVGTLPDPEPGPGAVRLLVEAASLNYHDVFTRRGMPGIKTPLPMVPGCDAVGRVDRLGDGAVGLEVGQRVLVDPVHWDSRTRRPYMIGDNLHGSLAELLVVDQSQVIPLPDEVSSNDAACLPVAYGTAYRMLATRAHLSAGETVLVLGASGGVGTCCVLLAKLFGAHVVAAAGSAEKCRRLIEIGADETIDYTTTDLVKHTRERTGSLLRGGGYDVVVNFTGGETWGPSIQCAKRGGRVVTCGATAGYEASTDLRYVWTAEVDILGSNAWQRSDLLALVELVRTGRLRPVIDRVVPLCDGPEALRVLEDRQVFGKIVVLP